MINVDDPYGARLAAELEPAPVTFALDTDASYRAADVQTGLEGSSFTVHGPDGAIELRSPLRGTFNVYNVARRASRRPARSGSGRDDAAAAVETAGQVPGRFETIDEGQGFAVIVDYAHTPDSLENVLQAARPLTTGRVHVVFGAGGDRDTGKRPLMGEIASRLADRVIVTSDNPRSERPEAIIDEILAGARPDVEHNADRREAIATAIHGAAPGDVVVIAGKGHEQGQEFADGRKLPFDDATVAREVAEEHGPGSMRSWSPEQIAQAAGARLLSVRRRTAPVPSERSIDSREAGPGALFVGLAGQRADGGRYAASALEAGAWGVLTTPSTPTRRRSRPPRESCLRAETRSRRCSDSRPRGGASSGRT